MKTLLALVLLSSTALAAPKDPRVDIAKRESAKLYRGQVPHDVGGGGYNVAKVNVLEQRDSLFLTQVVTKGKKNFCLIFEVDIVNNTPEVSVVANNNDVEGAFIQECSAAPTAEELSKFKLLNGWPAQ